MFEWTWTFPLSIFDFLLDWIVINIRNSVPVCWNSTLTRVEFIKDDLSISWSPLLHLLLCYASSMLIVVEIGLFDWHSDVTWYEVETLVKRVSQFGSFQA